MILGSRCKVHAIVASCALVWGVVAAGQSAWAADRIAYSRLTQQIDLYTITADGSDVVRLTNDPAQDWSPTWSPGGEALAFVSTRHTGVNHLFTLDLSSGSIERVTDGPVDGWPTWSRHDVIAFTCGGTDYEICTIDADGSHRRRLTDNAVEDSNASWSPDGEWIAFDTEGHLAVFDARGHHRRTIATPGLEAYEPSWSPDGRRIAFVGRAATSDPMDLYSVRAAGGGIRRLTETAKEESWPSWGPNGKWIVVQTSRGSTTALFRIRSDGGRRVRLTPDDRSDPRMSMEPEYRPR